MRGVILCFAAPSIRDDLLDSAQRCFIDEKAKRYLEYGDQFAVFFWNIDSHVLVAVLFHLMLVVVCLKDISVEHGHSIRKRCW